MNHIAGVHDELDGLADGNLQRGAHDIVLAGRILVVEAEGISGRIVYLFEVRIPKLAIRTGVAESEGELFGHQLDRDGVRIRIGKVYGNPDLGARQNNTHEQNGGGSSPDGFPLVVAMRIAGAAAVVAKAEDRPTQGELGEQEDDAGDDERAHELRVVSQAVLGNGWRKPPDLGCEEIHDDDGQHPADRSTQQSTNSLGLRPEYPRF